jgi:ANTAR domain
VTGDRLGRIWGLVAEQAAGRDGPVSAGDVCAAAVHGVQVTGAWLSATNGADAGHLMQVTDKVSERLAELQLTLGEGPSLDVSAFGCPALASDLADRESLRRWPVFAPAACEAGAAAVFAFPLAVGAIRTGVLGLYRDRPGELSGVQLRDALLFADAATLLVLDAQDHGPGGHGPGGHGPVTANGAPVPGSTGMPPGLAGQPADLAVHRAEIDQATGMLTEQLGVGIAEAFARLRAYAYVNDLRLGDVARDIVARRLRLYPGLGPSRDGGA